VCSSQPYQVCCLRSSHRRLRLPLSSPPWEELEGMKSDHSTILSRANTRTYTIGRWDLAVLQLIALKHLAHVAACGFPQRIQSLLNPIGGETSGTRGVVQPEVVVGVGGESRGGSASHSATLQPHSGQVDSSASEETYRMA
jgi:hypothetical protein